MKKTTSTPKTEEKATTASHTTTTREKTACEQFGVDPRLEPLFKKYVYMEDIIRLLDMAYIVNKNVLMHGPGGHGKSDIVVDFLELMGEDPFVLTMGSGTGTDILFGGVDIAEFNRTGKIEYLVENSWMNHEYVVFEEIFDAPDFILEQLKDIISSGYFRHGGQKFKIKTKLILCNTNRTRDEFAKNTSLQALMERFPLEAEVIWKNYNSDTYGTLLNVVSGGNADQMLVHILDSFAKANKNISPRIAIEVQEILEVKGPESLNFVADFRGNLKLLKNSIKQYKDSFKFRDLVESLEKAFTQFNDANYIDATDQDIIKEGIKKAKHIMTLVKGVDNVKVADELASKKASTVNIFKPTIEEIQKKLTEKLK